MAPRTRSQDLDRRISDFAADRHDVVSYQELIALGLRKGGIETRVAAGHLHVKHRGVFAVGRSRLTAEGAWRAAVLACGRGAVLSQASGAALWGLRPDRRGRIDVTIPTRNGRGRRRGLAIHRPRRALTAAEITVHNGIPVTTPARTLLDLADVVGPQALRRAIERAETLRLFDLRAIEAVIAQHAGRRKASRLVQALARFDPAPTRSELERLFLELCTDHGLPRPSVNVLLAGYEVDFYWPDAALVVETDGFATHGTRAAFERDRERDAALATAGLTVQRFSHRQVTRQATTVAETVRTLRRRAGRP